MVSNNTLDTLDRFKQSYPVNIEAAIRALGLSLLKNAELPARIAGHIKKLADNNFEIASTGRDHYFRQRFTMAHELGHYILHRNLLGDGVDDNIKYRSTEEGEFYNTSIDDVHEYQANAFAAHFLIPEKLLRSHIEENQGHNLKQIAIAFQVSPSAMRWRLKNIDLYNSMFAGE